MNALYWVRNDLRLHDNQALNELCKNETQASFIWAPTASFKRAHWLRKQFLNSSLRAFDKSLKTNGQKLFLSENSFLQTVESLLIGPNKLNGAKSISKIYYSREFAFDEVLEEKKLKQLAKAHNIQIFEFDQATLIAEKDLPFTLNDMPLVFTTFRKKIESHLKISSPQNFINKWPEPLDLNLNIFTEESNAENKTASNLGFTDKIKAGENEALEHLQNYIWQNQSVLHYKETRNGMLNWNDSSKLSFWLNTGALSPRHVYDELIKFENSIIKNDSTYWLFFELLWRDYFKFLSRKIGSKLFKLSGLSHQTPALVEPDEFKFKMWCEARTGDDFIDAAMNELNQTGWMSNRARQNVASYLVHNLKLPWIWGAAYFESRLIDYDPDLNWGNWLYLSGQGTDPRSRIFNTEKQAQDYDPDKKYRNKWLQNSKPD